MKTKRELQVEIRRLKRENAKLQKMFDNAFDALLQKNNLPPAPVTVPAQPWVDPWNPVRYDGDFIVSETSSTMDSRSLS